MYLPVFTPFQHGKRDRGHFASQSLEEERSVVSKRAPDSLLDDGSGPLIPANELYFRIDYASFDFITNI